MFVDELTSFAQQAADQRIADIAERLAAPVVVAVRGRPGVGCSTVGRALESAAADIRVKTGAGAADLDVHVFAEAVKPEDAGTLRPCLAVLNKADVLLAGGGTSDPWCARFAEILGVPVVAMSGLLAVAALDDVDAQCWADLQSLAADPGALTGLDGSFDGFRTAPLVVPSSARDRLLQVLDLFGIALTVTALRRDAAPAQIRALWRRVSGIDAVLQQLLTAGAEVRYRRMLQAVGELEALAVSDERVDAFLSRDDTVAARMATALDFVDACGLDAGPDEPLRRALHWRRRAPLGELQRTCAADIVRGSLRLWAQTVATPMRAVSK
ncbi:hypothetical protein [Mycobacterium vicinigordonae]|uniref:Uncharacterized protein n=1 Tax=Mycobacterium vicinigordonae TaxID=1719132 RepID=A0A7D6E1H9_9MYCO|nr:hypothetical protein [Mycobacterium vicinigordonae]QLL09947.1 hypothetical protein H0P51_02585 [Mycobacterium vicinigordonae]